MKNPCPATAPGLLKKVEEPKNWNMKKSWILIEKNILHIRLSKETFHSAV